MREYTVSEETSLKNFTDAHDAQASFSFRALLKRRDVRVNGGKVGEDVPLHAGDKVQYFLTPAEEGKKAFSVLYEDENVVVCDKESGVQSEAVYSALLRKGECFFLHRLDRNTAGVMIFAKNGAAERELLSAFRERRVLKVYEALCFGTFARPHALLAAYLRKDARAALVRVTDAPQAGAEKILTEYEVLRTEGEFTLVRVLLHSGKTHQIRAHLASQGHPIAGDYKYGDRAFNDKLKEQYGLSGQLLHSYRLCVPECGGALSGLSGKEIKAPLPSLFRKICEDKGVI